MRCHIGSIYRTNILPGRHGDVNRRRGATGCRPGPRGGDPPAAPLPSLAMSFRPEAIRGPGGTGAVVDYRLTRQSVIDQFRKGRLSRLDVCDAHPELRRAATIAGRRLDDACPICDDSAGISLVTYAFGPRLPAGGRCITSAREMAKLARGRPLITCYVVEVCTACGWNHLTRTFQVGGS